jgi:hypothetical protein
LCRIPARSYGVVLLQADHSMTDKGIMLSVNDDVFLLDGIGRPQFKLIAFVDSGVHAPGGDRESRHMS